MAFIKGMRATLTDGNTVKVLITDREDGTFGVNLKVEKPGTPTTRLATKVYSKPRTFPLPRKLADSKRFLRATGLLHEEHANIIATRLNYQVAVRRWVDQQLKKNRLAAIQGKPEWGELDLTF